MQTVIEIKGMMCDHCKNHVETALNALSGATATVDLDAGTATVDSDKPMNHETLTHAVTEAGYEVVSIREG